MLLRHLRYLLAVADHGGFTRAAEALHVSQPTLSQQIRQLEETLGVTLFDRTSRTVKPTDAGEAYIECARRVLVELEAGKRALHDVKDLSRGTLRLAMTPTFMAYLVGPLVRDFAARYPGIHLQIFELSMDDIEAGLADDSLDIAIAFTPVRNAEIDAFRPLPKRWRSWSAVSIRCMPVTRGYWQRILLSWISPCWRLSSLHGYRWTSIFDSRGSRRRCTSR